MSAYEKLKAVDFTPEELRSALPEFKLMVRAIEDITLRPDMNGMPPRDCGYVRFSEVLTLRFALAAFEEKLGAE